MDLRERLRTVLQFLKLSDKAKNNQLTSEDVEAIVNRYQKEFQANLRDDMDADSKPRLSQEDMNEMKSLLAGIVAPKENVDTPEDKSTKQTEATAEDLLSLTRSVV